MTRVGRMLLIPLAAAAVRAGAESQLEAVGETIHTPGISLRQVTASWRHTSAPGGYDLQLARSQILLDYVPAVFDFRGTARPREEAATALQVGGRRRLGETWMLLGSAGGSTGHTNYRAVWLDEYFRQQYAGLVGPGLDTYRRAAPRSLNTGIGARWEYLPASGFAELTASWRSDDVAPGYEIDFNGLTRGPETLHGTALEFKLENIVTPRIRTQAVLRAADVSGRARRYGGEAAINVAIGEHCILRLNAGGATEAPAFNATQAGFVLDYAPGERWGVFVSGRRYRDSGEIENALLFTSAAPGLRSAQWGGGLRIEQDTWAARFTVSALRTDYGATNPNTDFFRHLYRDRNWVVVQAAISHRY